MVVSLEEMKNTYLRVDTSEKMTKSCGTLISDHQRRICLAIAKKK